MFTASLIFLLSQFSCSNILTYFIEHAHVSCFCSLMAGVGDKIGVLLFLCLVFSLSHCVFSQCFTVSSVDRFQRQNQSFLRGKNYVKFHILRNQNVNPFKADVGPCGHVVDPRGHILDPCGHIERLSVTSLQIVSCCIL